VVPAAEFFKGFLTTALEPDELLVEVQLPAAPLGSRTAFVEFARRHGDFALAGAAAVVVQDDSGAIVEARLAFMGADSRALRARDAEAALRGAYPDDALLRELAGAAANRLSPPSDAHGTARYRRRIAAVVMRRALQQATDAAMSRTEVEA